MLELYKKGNKRPFKYIEIWKFLSLPQSGKKSMTVKKVVRREPKFSIRVTLLHLMLIFGFDLNEEEDELELEEIVRPMG